MSNVCSPDPPDPCGKFKSFAHHNNAMLRDFLDRFGFEYEFVSATECYRAGRFDDALKSVLTHYEAIMGVMLPTLREDRRKTYSPILPVCPRPVLVLQVPLTEWNADAGPVSYYYPVDLQYVTVSILSFSATLPWLFSLSFLFVSFFFFFSFFFIFFFLVFF